VETADMGLGRPDASVGPLPPILPNLRPPVASPRIARDRVGEPREPVGSVQAGTGTDYTPLLGDLKAVVAFRKCSGQG
jgi:hypothetical protein